MRHLVDAERVKPAEKFQSSVRLRIESLFSVDVSESRVLRRTMHSPMGPTTIYALDKTVEALADPGICAHCKLGENIVAEYGLVTKALCDSCRIILSKKCKCSCGRFRWVTPIGIPVPLCKYCSKDSR